MDEDHRGAIEELGIDTPLVRPELLDDLGVVVTGPPAAEFAMISLAVVLVVPTNHDMSPSLRPSGARSSHCHIVHSPSKPRAYAE